MRKLLLFACVSLALSGCGDKASAVSIPTPPPDKLAHGPIPGRPIGSGPPYVDSNGVTRNAITDEDNGAYLRQLRNLAATCHGKLDWLDSWFKTLTDGP